MHTRGSVTAFFLLGLVFVGCVGDDPTPSQPADGDAGSGTSGGASSSGGGGSSSGQQASDGGSTCTAGEILGCVADETALEVCSADGRIERQSCEFNCATTPAAHCRTFVPHAPVPAALLEETAAPAVVLTGAVRIDTDTGLIDNVRAANEDPEQSETNGGVSFFRNGTTGVFGFSRLTIEKGATVTVVGQRALTIVAATEITVAGVIDARSHTNVASPSLCPALAASGGGFPGGSPSDAANQAAGAGPGGGKANYNTTAYGGGGGGGGNGDKGGIGGSGNAGAKAAGLAGALVPLSYPIAGGSGGGGGSGSVAYGGSGGGAVQLVAGTKITFGGTVGIPAGINVSGCGGKGGSMTSSAAGGGAGGTILAEAPLVLLTDGSSLIANGGGGGGDNNHDGMVSDQAPSAPSGGLGGGYYATGGPGGYATTAGGGNAFSGQQNVAGGGGGGSAGRIVLLNRSGSLSPALTAKLSPQLDIKNSAQDPVVAVGKIDLQ